MRLVHLLFVGSALVVSARSDCVIAWPSGVHGTDTWGASHLNSDPAFAFSREVADDFDFVGRITRVYVAGFNGGPTGAPTPVDGAWVRFFEWTPSGPGSEQAAYFVAGNDPALGVEPRPSGVEVSLAAPFVATGKHFVSVQVDFTAYGWWEPWQANASSPRLSTAWVRANGGAWSLYTPPFQSQPVQADVDLVLYTDPAPACADWTPVAVPSPGPDSFLVDVDARAADDVWALGNETVAAGATLESFPFALHYDGGAWSLVDLPASPPVGSIGSRATMEAIEAIAADDVWAAGARYMVVPGGWVGHQVRADHYDGNSWTTMDTPLPPTGTSAGYSGSHVTDVLAVASNDVWFVGEWSGPYPGVAGLQPALAMHWNGSAFALVPTPEVMPAGGNGLDAIDGVRHDDVWAVGGAGDGDLAGYSYVVHWDGVAWSHVPAPVVGTMQRLHAVEAIAADDVWIAGEAYTSSGLVGFVQHWDGALWTNVPNAPSSFAATFHANSASDLWLGLWHYDGADWTRESVAGCDPWSGAGSIGGEGGRLFMAGAATLPGSVPFVIERRPTCASGAYCTSATTTHGCRPAIASSGTASASASSGFTIHVTQVEGQAQGILFYGASGQQAVPWSTSSTSYLCVRSPVQRLPAHGAGGTAGACDGVLAEDWNAYMAANPGALGQPRFAGQTFDAQAWFRDPPAPKTTNLSNALHFTLAP